MNEQAVQHIWGLADVRGDLLWRNGVGFDGHQRLTALLAAAQLEGADVDVAVHEVHEVRDVCDDTRHITMQDEDGFLVPRELHFHAVDDVDANVSAPDAGPLHEAAAAVRQIVADACRVRMRIRDVPVDEIDLDALFLRDVERIPDAGIVGLEAHDPTHDGTVRTMTTTCTRERTGQDNVTAGWLLPIHQLIGHATETTRARGMRTRRTDHHRSDNIENIHILLISFDSEIVPDSGNCQESGRTHVLDRTSDSSPAILLYINHFNIKRSVSQAINPRKSAELRR